MVWVGRDLRSIQFYLPLFQVHPSPIHASHRDWEHSLPEGTAAAPDLQCLHTSSLFASPSRALQGPSSPGGRARYQVGVQDKAPTFRPGGGSSLLVLSQISDLNGLETLSAP